MTVPNSHLLPHILPFLIPHLPPTAPPLIVAISGPQGSGKTTVASHLAAALRSPPHNLSVAILSIDDLYLRHTAQRALAAKAPHNRFFQHRGVPGTHDLGLGAAVFAALHADDGRAVALPVFDKSLFAGAGDRARDAVEVPSGGVQVLLFEGWCVGFRHCGGGIGVEGDMLEVDRRLRGYDVLTDQFDLLIHIDAEDIRYVYDWRLEQEHALIAARGEGMTDQQVVAFVDGYMPSYELYVPALSKGAFHEKGRQLRIVIDKKREVIKVEEL